MTFIYYVVRGCRAVNRVELLVYLPILAMLLSGFFFTNLLIVQVYLLITFSMLPAFIGIRGFIDELDEISRTVRH